MDAVRLRAQPEGDLPPGTYVAGASDPAYGLLDAMLAAGDALLLGERWTAEGEKLLAVEVPHGERLQRNQLYQGAVRIGGDYFTRALRDYEDWPEKWWREAIQNSVDAGATHVDCRVTEEAERVVVSIDDDGRGMDEDTLIHRFMVLAGTTKVGAGGTTGGFGKAKELLLFPWLDWAVHTRDRILRGVGSDYGVWSAEHRAGTRITVTMPRDQTTTVAACLAFLGKCDVPGVRFTVNGEVAHARLRVTERIREFGDKAALYHDPKGTFAQKLLVRTNGLFMFSIWTSAGVEGTLIIELLKPSIELLLANRDGFRDSELRYAVQNYVNQLAADTKSALRKKQGLIREKFRGTGKFAAAETKRLTAAALEAVQSLTPERRVGRTLELSAEQLQEVLTVIKHLGGSEQPEREVPDDAPGADDAVDRAAPLNFRVSADLARTMLDGTPLAGPSHVEAAVKQLAWEPDFFLVNEIEGYKVPRKFYPETMAPNIRKLARFWAEMCRFVLIQLGSTETFGVGFVFDRSVGAEYVHEDEEHWLLLNPFVESQTSRPVLSLSDKDHVSWLYAAAVHECTHMADGLSYHDESFAAAMTRNVARTSGKERQIREIRRMVVARGPKASGGAARPKRRPGGALAEQARALTVAAVQGVGSIDEWGLRGDVFRHLSDEPPSDVPRGQWFRELVLGPLDQEGAIRWDRASEMVYRR